MYRVFISYSHHDLSLASRIEKILSNNKLVPMFDRNFAFGSGFHDQIRRYIEHAHVFMPIITMNSQQRGWVHQEIGYATALNIPVLPIAVDGAMPGEMIQQHHAVTLQSIKEKKKKGDQCESDCVIRKAPPPCQCESPTIEKTRGRVIPRSSLDLLEKYLVPATFDLLIDKSRAAEYATFSCAELHEDRTARIVEYAECVSNIQSCVSALKGMSRVRQKGGLSSFHIPNKSPGDSAWKERYGIEEPDDKTTSSNSAKESESKPPTTSAGGKTSVTRSDHHCRLQREERIALTRLAIDSGCRLIVSPNIEYGAFGKTARKHRLEHLQKFLTSNEVSNIEIAFDEETNADHSLTIVGDWFLAESVAALAKSGYQQTVFSRHAPSMQGRKQRFDELFIELLDKRGWSERNSRDKAIKELDDLIKKA